MPKRALSPLAPLPLWFPNSARALPRRRPALCSPPSGAVPPIDAATQPPTTERTVAIVGAGAAGYFAAVQLAELDPSCRVRLLERSRKPLAKVAISGGGRCNVTHHCFDPKELARFYPRGSKELRAAFHHWQPRDTVDWFERRGVALKTEDDGRMFPVTDSSQTIIDCLSHAARAAGVELSLQTGVSSISRQADGAFELSLSTGEQWRARRVIIATGGGQNEAGHALARALGHSIAPLAPSLFTFHIEHPLLEGLQGLSLPQVRVDYPPAKLSQSGPVVFTHWGLSGPGILKLSAWGARVFQEQDYRCELRVNWLGAATVDQIRQALDEARRDYARKALSSANPFELPRRFWERLLDYVSVPADTQWAQLPKKVAHQLAETLACTPLRANGKSMNKEEFVTCGGVSLKEVDFRSMQSRLCPGLYFAGEALDVDGVTGGFNFQAAWTTARLAALAVAESFRNDAQTP